PDSAALNEAHDVSPMNGGIVQPSTETFVSALGDVTLKTPSSAMSVPLSPVISSIRAVSSLGASACAGPAIATATARSAASVHACRAFICVLLPWCPALRSLTIRRVAREGADHDPLAHVRLLVTTPSSPRCPARRRRGSRAARGAFGDEWPPRASPGRWRASGDRRSP